MRRCLECGGRAGWPGPHREGCLSGALSLLETEAAELREDIAQGSPEFTERVRALRLAWADANALAETTVQRDAGLLSRILSEDP